MLRRLLPALLLAAPLACEKPPPPPPPRVAPPVSAAPKSAEVSPVKLVAFQALPADTTPLDERAALGKLLYFEPRLSKTQTLSCNSCHAMAQAGQDGRPTPTGADGQPFPRNTPTTWNAALGLAQGWDGAAPTVEAFTKLHLADPRVMGAVEKPLLARLAATPEYAAAFAKAFGPGAAAISLENTANALAAWVRRLTTPGRWDRFLAGDRTALTDDEKRGVNAYVDAGCLACHAGPGMGGALYQKLGLVRPWPNLTDPGRAGVTKEKADEGVFKSVSLRNVARTGPWLHDGSMTSLDEGVAAMARHQLGRELKEREIKDIVTFLGALSGDPSPALAAPPELPKAPKKG
jgi:cytochrome c peroxidase